MIRGRRTHYGLALACFVLGLLTKTVVATLPAALLVIFWWRRGTLSFNRDWLPLVPFFALGAVAGLTTAWIERSLIGAAGAPFEMTLLQRFLLAGRIIWFYLGKLAWPANLTFIYPRWTIDPDRWSQWTFPIAALATTAVLWAIRKRCRSPLAAWLFFCGTLFPVLGFLNVYPFIYSFVADHFQYLATLGPIALAAAGMARALAWLPVRGRAIGFALSRTGQVPQAIDQYRLAVQLNPNYANAHYNLGTLQSGLGNREEALASLEQAIRLQPDLAEAHNNLGAILREMDHLPPAIEHFQAAVRIRPGFVQAHANLVLALNSADRPKEAVAAAQAGIEAARSTSQQAAAEQLEEWLKHYQAELRRGNEAAPTSQSPPKPQ